LTVKDALSADPIGWRFLFPPNVFTMRWIAFDRGHLLRFLRADADDGDGGCVAWTVEREMRSFREKTRLLTERFS
jgi:hypothetical protein